MRINMRDSFNLAVSLTIIIGLGMLLAIIIVAVKESRERPTIGVSETIVEREIYLIHETEPARITCYLWTGSPMANGIFPYDGAVASSDRSIPFGTEVIIDGKKYIVGDRTNHRFQDFETQTMDIYWEDSLEDCLKFGVQYKDIAIIN